MTDYVVYDVFTSARFGGNPLAVIPDGTRLDDDDLQRIAREFNFSETTFVFPPENPRHDARIRIFTPTQEIPFAGHSIIGTAVALSKLGQIRSSAIFELGVGPIAVTVDGGTASFVTRTPLRTWDGLTPDMVARAISHPTDVLRTDRHPPVIASVGLPFAIAELGDSTAFETARADVSAFRDFEASWPAPAHFDLLIYLRDGSDIHARMFAPLDGIPEDPATGSAAAALAAFLGRLEGQSTQFHITQGVEMGRPSQIRAGVEVSQGAPVAVTITGQAVQTLAGRLIT